MAKKKTKRANGEGTFYRLSDRTWVHQITLGRKENGAPDRKSFKGKTRTECIARRDAYLEEKDRLAQEEKEQELIRNDYEAQRRLLGHSVDSEVLFSEAFPAWLSLYKAPPTKKATTYGTYVDIYNTHFKENFGDKPLYAITQDEVQAYYNSLQLNGSRKDGKPGSLAPKTIRNHHMLLKDFFTYAEKKYRLESNPALATDRPEVTRPAMRVLSQDEMTIFIQEIMRETQRVAMLFDLFTGLREGELLALEIADFDLKTQTFRVQRNITRVKTLAIDFNNPNIRVLNYRPENKTQLIIQNTPKTKSSNRELPMSDGVCELIVRHLFTLRNSMWPNPLNLMFPSTTGTHIDPKSFEIRLKAVSKRCEIKKVNPHALRHTFATRLVEENVPLSIIKDLLGHSSITTTQVYTHRNTEVEREAMGELAPYLDFSALSSAPRLNGTRRQLKFAEIELPDFSQNKTASI